MNYRNRTIRTTGIELLKTFIKFQVYKHSRGKTIRQERTSELEKKSRIHN